MNFILNLTTFLLISIGLIAMVGSMPSNRGNLYSRIDCEKISEDIKTKLDKAIRDIYIYSVLAIILGIGIIVARVFS